MSAPVRLGDSSAPDTEHGDAHGGVPAALTAAAETPEPRVPALVAQPHGGALLAGGLPGNRGGPGRPKAELRARMRAMLDDAHEAMAAALAGERLAGEARAALLADPRVAGLPEAARAEVEAAIAEHVTATLTMRELIQTHESLARYGVGVQQEKDTTSTKVSYIVHYPSKGQRARSPADTGSTVRLGRPAGLMAGEPVAVVPAPGAAEDTGADLAEEPGR